MKDGMNFVIDSSFVFNRSFTNPIKVPGFYIFRLIYFYR
jgi:hypothetical protein